MNIVEYVSTAFFLFLLWLMGLFVFFLLFVGWSSNLYGYMLNFFILDRRPFHYLIFVVEVRIIINLLINFLNRSIIFLLSFPYFSRILIILTIQSRMISWSDIMWEISPRWLRGLLIFSSDNKSLLFLVVWTIMHNWFIDLL